MGFPGRGMDQIQVRTELLSDQQSQALKACLILQLRHLWFFPWHAVLHALGQMLLSNHLLLPCFTF